MYGDCLQLLLLRYRRISEYGYMVKIDIERENLGNQTFVQMFYAVSDEKMLYALRNSPELVNVYCKMELLNATLNQYMTFGNV